METNYWHFQRHPSQFDCLHRFSPQKILRSRIIGFGKQMLRRFVISCVLNWSRGLSKPWILHRPSGQVLSRSRSNPLGQIVLTRRLRAAAYAALKSKALMEIHTEKGALAEKACIYFMDLGLHPSAVGVVPHGQKTGYPVSTKSWHAWEFCLNTIRSIGPTTLR